MKTKRPELNNESPEDVELFSRQRNKEDINKSESTLNKPSISITESQERQGQLLSQDNVENVLSVSSQTELTTDTSSNIASTISMSEKSAKLLPKCFCQRTYNNNKMQIHSANTWPTQKYSMDRDNQHKKHKDSLKLQIHQLTQEIAAIRKDIENKKKQYSLISHRVKNKQSTDESSETQNRFSSNNISGILDESDINVDFEKGHDKNIIEFTDPEIRREYLELIKKKKELQHKIKKEQLEIDVILAVKMRLEEQIKLLSTQIDEVEERKDIEQNRINCESKYDEKTQDNVEITINELEKEDNERQTKTQHRLEQFGVDSKEDQFKLIITDDALIKDIHGRIAAFEKKLDEIMDAHNDLEKFIRKNREQINLSQLEDKSIKSINRTMNFQDRTKLIG
ncbi:uncharacterized protein [Chelonus insularis]|uniref:uncharacterized protein n=1 Tax=Chelonus insularis TaxID=460826 RepID=UPI00158A190E|nr:uncharacterized protein LOC118066004 [Chelonus insularis]